MAKYRIKSPDGQTFEITAPDSASQDEVMSYAKAQFDKMPAMSMEKAAPQAAETAGSALRDIPRQVGLAARYGLEGLGNMANTVTEPIKQIIVNPAARALGLPEAKSTGAAATSLADAIGLPSPQTPNERVVGDASRLVASSMGMGGAAGAASNVLTGAGKAVASKLAANQLAQGAGAASSGLAGGSVREAGGGPAEQFGAAVLGGVVGGVGTNMLANGAQTATRAVKNALTRETTQLRAADQQINLILQRQGVDWSQVPERIRQGMRAEVAAAMNTGQPLDADAVRRLLVMQRAGVTPTVGMITQDPGQITREMNLAKTGANSTDTSLQRLPGLQNANTRALLGRLDETGAANAPDAYRTGQGLIDSLQARVDASRNNINSLYETARASAGRDIPIDHVAFTQRANNLIDEAMLGGALPPGVANTMNKVAKGEIPLTVDVAEQIKTQIGKLQRATSDGQTRMALGLVRQALDEAPIYSPRVNPGNLPAVPGTVPPSPSIAGNEAINAFTDARRANAAWMSRVEANPALRAVLDGVEPDKFVSRYVTGQGATAADLRSLMAEISPQAAEGLRQNVVKYLRDAATNSTDDITKFSNDAYRRALRNLGDAKLNALFPRETVDTLKNVGEAAKYMQAQPAGSAVNNSNSGALMLGRGLDMLDSAANYIPFGGKDIIKGAIQGAQQTQVLRPRNALALPPPVVQRGVSVNPLLIGAYPRDQ